MSKSNLFLVRVGYIIKCVLTHRKVYKWRFGRTGRLAQYVTKFVIQYYRSDLSFSLKTQFNANARQDSKPSLLFPLVYKC
jgi:hypothetical protein